MARKRVSLGGKKFFSLVVLSSLAIGLLFTANFAVQQKTSTESQASCVYKPKINYMGAESQPDVVVYKFEVTNPCERWMNYGLKINNEPGPSWKFRFSIDGSRWIDNYVYVGAIKPREIDHIRLRVVPPNWAKNGTHSFTLVACRHENTLLSGSNNCSYKPLTYVKD